MQTDFLDIDNLFGNDPTPGGQGLVTQNPTPSAADMSLVYPTSNPAAGNPDKIATIGGTQYVVSDDNVDSLITKQAAFEGVSNDGSSLAAIGSALRAMAALPNTGTVEVPAGATPSYDQQNSAANAAGFAALDNIPTDVVNDVTNDFNTIASGTKSAINSVTGGGIYNYLAIASIAIVGFLLYTGRK